MAIETLISTPNATQCEYHEVLKIEVSDPANTPHIIIYAGSWVNREARESLAPPVWAWAIPNHDYQFSITMEDIPEIESALIITEGSPFIGGVIPTSGEDIDRVRLKKLAWLRNEFTHRNTLPLVVHNLGTFDADEKSQFKITQTVLLARTLADMGEPVSINFTRADNTIVTLDLITTQQLGLTLAEREQRLRDRKTELRAQIMEATSKEALEAVRWDPAPVLAPAPSTAPTPTPGNP